jgi:hypothetical protein
MRQVATWYTRGWKRVKFSRSTSVAAFVLELGDQVGVVVGLLRAISSASS